MPLNFALLSRMAKPFVMRVTKLSIMENNPVGRPTNYTPELAAEICELISSGLSVNKVAAMEGMPAARTVFLWLSKHEEFMRMYTRATSSRADAMFEEMFEIADDGTNDLTTRPDGSEVVDHDVVQRSRLRIETRKWALARMNPRKFGERVTTELVGEGGGPIVNINAEATAKEAADLWQAMREAD